MATSSLLVEYYGLEIDPRGQARPPLSQGKGDEADNEGKRRPGVSHGPKATPSCTSASRGPEGQDPGGGACWPSRALGHASRTEAECQSSFLNSSTDNPASWAIPPLCTR